MFNSLIAQSLFKLGGFTPGLPTFHNHFLSSTMKNFFLTTLFLTCLLPLVAVAQDQKFASLGDFKLESGEVIRDCQIGYRTFGTLNEDKSNAILFTTWASGTTEQLA